MSVLYFYLAYLRVEHDEAVLHIMGYSRQTHNSLLVFHSNYPEIDLWMFKQCDPKQFYHGAKKEIPPNAPEPQGKEVDLHMMVNSDHTGNKAARISHSGFNVFAKNALVD